MIKLESGNPPLQLGKAVCNSADYLLIKQYTASFLMLQRGEEQRETRHCVVPRLLPACPRDQSHQDGQNSHPGIPSRASQTGRATVPLCLGTARAGAPRPAPGCVTSASLAKLDMLQEQLVLRWHLARESTKRMLALSPIPALSSQCSGPSPPRTHQPTEGQAPAPGGKAGALARFKGATFVGILLHHFGGLLAWPPSRGAAVVVYG